MPITNQDIDDLQLSMRQLFQSIKQHRYWTSISSTSTTMLDRPSAAILMMLSSNGTKPRHIHDMANALRVESPSITRKTQELESAGLIRRLSNQDDRRALDIE
ncbi:MAG: MarR family transcriptional regulator, partial [Candidatus Saccharimonadales bacterium]